MLLLPPPPPKATITTSEFFYYHFPTDSQSERREATVKSNWDFGVDVKQPLSLSVNTHSFISLCFYFPILFFCFVLTIIENIYVHTDDHNNKNLVNCYKQKQIQTIKTITIVHIGSKMSLNNIQRSCSSQMSICSQDADHRSISLFESCQYKNIARKNDVRASKNV